MTEWKLGKRNYKPLLLNTDKYNVFTWFKWIIEYINNNMLSKYLQKTLQIFKENLSLKNKEWNHWWNLE